MIHIYQGFCPDELQPDSRDPDCPACQVEAERDALRKQLAALQIVVKRIYTDGWHTESDCEFEGRHDNTSDEYCKLCEALRNARDLGAFGAKR